MKRLFNIVLVLLSGCSANRNASKTGVVHDESVRIIEQYGTNAVPRHSWTELEKGLFNSVEGKGMLLEGSTIRISGDHKTQFSWEVLMVNDSQMVVKRKGKSDNRRAEPSPPGDVLKAAPQE